MFVQYFFCFEVSLLTDTQEARAPMRAAASLLGGKATEPRVRKTKQDITLKFNSWSLLGANNMPFIWQQRFTTRSLVNGISIISKMIKCASPGKHKHQYGASQGGKWGCAIPCTLTRKRQCEERLLRATEAKSQ